MPELYHAGFPRPATELFRWNCVEYDESVTEEADMVKFLLWCILLVLCWPLALLALVAFPFVWLLLLPLRLLGIAVGGALGLVSAVIFLPVRVLRGI
jgi:hypothetical protein